MEPDRSRTISILAMRLVTCAFAATLTPLTPKTLMKRVGVVAVADTLT
jgi:hypothetical protein